MRLTATNSLNSAIKSGGEEALKAIRFVPNCDEKQSNELIVVSNQHLCQIHRTPRFLTKGNPTCYRLFSIAQRTTKCTSQRSVGRITLKVSLTKQLLAPTSDTFSLGLNSFTLRSSSKTDMNHFMIHRNWFTFIVSTIIHHRWILTHYLNYLSH